MLHQDCPVWDNHFKVLVRLIKPKSAKTPATTETERQRNKLSESTDELSQFHQTNNIVNIKWVHFLRLFSPLLVGLLAGFDTNYWKDFRDTWWEDGEPAREQTITGTFGGRSEIREHSRNV